MAIRCGGLSLCRDRCGVADSNKRVPCIRYVFLYIRPSKLSQIPCIIPVMPSKLVNKSNDYINVPMGHGVHS